MLDNIKFKVRTIFLTGIAVLFPAIISIYIAYILYNTIIKVTSPLVKYILQSLLGLPGSDYIVPVVGFVLVIAAIFSIGLLATNYFGKKLIILIEKVLLNIPLLSSVFSAAKQFLDALSLSSKKGFSKAVLVEYPRKGTYTIGFLTTSAEKIFKDMDGPSDMVYVFIPTTPNPTSGWLLIVKRSELTFLDIKIEDAIKLIISGGLVHSDNDQPV